jgi:4-hydroxy-2-oxoheptanedioate aldolase
LTHAHPELSVNKNLAIASAFRQRLISGNPVFGAWAMVPNPSVIEVMARLKFDFLLLDGEHSPIEAGSLSTLLPSAELHGAPSSFRPRSQAASDIKTALDAGASGVMVPMVETVEEARAIVSVCRYAPLGQRGIGPWRASGFYDQFADYLQRANDATTVVLQIESATGLDNVEAIAATAGLDVLYVGPSDLSSSLGNPSAETMTEALRRVANAARGAGKAVGIDVYLLERVPELVEMGYSFFTIGSDIGFIQSAGRALVGDIASCLDGLTT